jgi:hypothetical protein
VTSSDDTERDTELLRFENGLHTRDEIEELCRRHAVLALVYDGTPPQGLVAVVDRAGKWEGLGKFSPRVLTR